MSPQRLILGLLLLLSNALSIRAAETIIPRQQHPWAHFAVGSWKKTTAVTQALDAKGQVTGTTVTETKTTLDRVDDDGVTLRIESTVEMAGKRFETPVQVVRQDYSGFTPGHAVDLKSLEAEPVTIEGKQIRCQVWQVRCDAADGRRSAKYYYANNIAPYLLRRETTVADATNPQKTIETTGEIVSLDMPYRVRDELHTVAFEKTTARAAQSTTTTVAVLSPDIPGGIVSHTSKEVDSTGRILSRSTLDLNDYGVAGDENHPAQIRRRFLLRDRLRAREN